jgi:hypothetical protein
VEMTTKNIGGVEKRKKTVDDIFCDIKEVRGNERERKLSCVLAGESNGFRAAKNGFVNRLRVNDVPRCRKISSHDTEYFPGCQMLLLCKLRSLLAHLRF